MSGVIYNFYAEFHPDAVLYTLCALVVAAAVQILSSMHRRKYSYYKAPSPRVRAPWRLFGNVEVVERVTDRHRLYTEWHEQLGPFVRIRIAHRSMLLVADPAAANAILTKGPSYVPRKPFEYKAFDVAHGLHGYNGMLTHQDEGTWRAARKAITPAFTLSEVKKQYPTILQCMQDTISNLDHSLIAGQLDFDIEHHMLVATNKLIARGFLQLPDGMIDPEQQAEDVAFIMATASRFVCEPWRWFGHLYLPFLTAEGRRLWFARRRLAGWAEAIYDVLHERYESGPVEDDHSLAACLMRITDKHGNTPKRGALVAEICDALTASETVPSTIMWTLYCIAVRPKLQQQLQQELAAAGVTTTTITSGTISTSLDSTHFPDQQKAQLHEQLYNSNYKAPLLQKATKQPASELNNQSANSREWDATSSAEDAAPPAVDPAVLKKRLEQLLAVFAAGGPEFLRQLPLLQACLHEAMRLYPAGAPAAPRETDKPTQVGPYLVPPGVIVFPNLYAIMNYSGNWTQPEQFQPERWSEPHAEKDPTTGVTRWLPFSLGPKACAGQNLALLQSKADLALLLAAFEWSLAPSMGGEEGVSARTYLGVTIKVQGGLWLRATPRI